MLSLLIMINQFWITRIATLSAPYPCYYCRYYDCDHSYTYRNCLDILIIEWGKILYSGYIPHG